MDRKRRPKLSNEDPAMISGLPSNSANLLHTKSDEQITNFFTPLHLERRDKTDSKIKPQSPTSPKGEKRVTLSKLLAGKPAKTVAKPSENASLQERKNCSPTNSAIGHLRKVLEGFRGCQPKPSANKQKLSRLVEADVVLNTSNNSVKKVTCKSANSSQIFLQKKPGVSNSPILRVESSEGPLKINANYKKNLNSSNLIGLVANKITNPQSSKEESSAVHLLYDNRFNFSIKRKSNAYKNISKTLKKSRDDVAQSMRIDLRNSRIKRDEDMLGEYFDSSVEKMGMRDELEDQGDCCLQDASLIKQTDGTLSIASKSALSSLLLMRNIRPQQVGSEELFRGVGRAEQKGRADAQRAVAVPQQRLLLPSAGACSDARSAEQPPQVECAL